jgi:hypothetical protein
VRRAAPFYLEGKSFDFKVKRAVGFTLPWARVTLHQWEERNVEDNFSLSGSV